MALPPWKLQVISISITPTTIQALYQFHLTSAILPIIIPLMAFVEYIKIENCNYNKGKSIPVIVDLKKPEQIGKVPGDNGEPYCPDFRVSLTSHTSDRDLSTNKTGKKKQIEGGHFVAVVKISCPHKDCLYHK